MEDKFIYIIFARRDHLKVMLTTSELEYEGVGYVLGLGSAIVPEDKEEILSNIEKCSSVMVFLSSNAADSKEVRHELVLALEHNKRIISVYLEDFAQNEARLFSLAQSDFLNYDDDTFFEKLTELPAVKECISEQSPRNRSLTSGLASIADGDAVARVVDKNDTVGTHVMACEAIPPTEPAVENKGTQTVKDKENKPFVPTVIAPALKKKTLAQRVKGLFGSKTSDISFSVLAPESLNRDEYTIIDFYAFEEEFRHIVERAKVERTRKEGAITETDGGHLKIRMGTRITVRLTSPDIEIKNGEEVREWAGKYVKFDFSVFVPREYGRNQLLFNAEVYFESVLATRINFTVYCNSFGFQRPKLERRDIRSAFISYASGDRERVALILQGMRRTRPDLDVFFDVETLKSGEDWENTLSKEIDRRDVLYLCWSRLAKESPWVEREWRYALEKKGLDGIEPIPLALPKDCPPPEELKSKHFGALELYYR